MLLLKGNKSRVSLGLPKQVRKDSKYSFISKQELDKDIIRFHKRGSPVYFKGDIIVKRMEKTTVTFVIGANATGKTTFIKNHFSDKDAVILNVYDYQQRVYKNARFFGNDFECLYKANEDLLSDVIAMLRQGKNVVVEHTLYKAKRRIAYIDKIRKEIENVDIMVYVMCPGDEVWKSYITKRRINGSFQSYKNDAAQIEFPNPIEGFDRIYEVVNNNILLRMDEPQYGLVDTARKELSEETQRLCKAKEKAKAKSTLLESMNTRPFWHYCESCGKRGFMTATEAFQEGWNYPPHMGAFALLGPRICGNCHITSTLFWKVQQQDLPIVSEKKLTNEELKTWTRIKNEPDSLLVEEK